MAATPTDDDSAQEPSPPAPRRAAPPSSAAGLLGRAAGRRVAAARRLAQTAKESAKDPQRRQAALGEVGPAFGAALDKAGLRNEAGKVDVLKVAQAARSPRSAVTRVGASMVAATAGLITDSASKPAVASHQQLVAPTDADILAEWTAEHPLKDRLVGPPALDALNEVAGTLAETLRIALAVNEDAWGEDNDKVVRLALAVVRRFGLQPEELGGNGSLDAVFADRINRMRMAMAIARNGWSCDLSVWFEDGYVGK